MTNSHTAMDTFLTGEKRKKQQKKFGNLICDAVNVLFAADDCYVWMCVSTSIKTDVENFIRNKIYIR